MSFLSKYGVARHIYIPMVKRAVVDHAVGADWTPAAGDVKISKDGGATANVTNLPSAIAMGNSALWDFSLTATELEAAQVMVTIADSATKAVEDSGFIIETYGHASGQHAVDLDDGVRAGLTALPNAAAEAAGGLFTRGTGAGQINQAADGMIDTNPVRLNNVSQSLLDLKDFADEGYDPATNKVQGVVLVDTVTTLTGVSAATVADAVWDEDATAHQTLGTFGKAVGDPLASPNSTYDYVSGLSVVGIADAVWNVDATTHQILGTFGKAIGDPGADTDTLYALVNANLQTPVSTPATIADAVWDEAIAGHLTAGSTGAALDNAGAAGTPPTAAAIADAVWDEALAGHLSAGSTGEALDNAGAAGTPPTAAEIADEVQTRTIAAVTVVNGLAANTVTAFALAADAVTEIQAGLATAAALATVDGIVDDILLDTAEIGVAGAGLTAINLPDQTMNITGNITGNLSGSVGSVTGLTTATIADAVWDEPIAGHLAAGSTGEALTTAGAASPTVDQIADEVETRTIAAVTLVNGLAANTVTAAALATDAANEIADALLDRANAIESGITPRGAMRIGVAADAGKTDGMASAGTAHLRDVADSKNRVTATTDGAGNRTATAVDTS